MPDSPLDHSGHNSTAAVSSARSTFYAAAIAFQERPSRTIRSLLLRTARTFALAAHPEVMRQAVPEITDGLLIVIEDDLCATAARIEDLAGEDAKRLIELARVYTAAWWTRRLSTAPLVPRSRRSNRVSPDPTKTSKEAQVG